MSFLSIEQKAETLRANVDKVLEDRRVQTDSYFKRVLIGIIALLIVVVILTLFSQWRIEQRIGEPLPAIVHLVMTTDTPNPVVCPGDTLKYSVARDVSDFLVGRAVVVVKNLNDKRQEMSSGTDVIFDADQVKLSSNWQLPKLLPATLTRPERPWAAGDYTREIAIVSYLSDYEIEAANIYFRVGANCPGVINS